MNSPLQNPRRGRGIPSPSAWPASTRCIPWLHERRIAVLGSDGVSDALPGAGIEGWPIPVHQCCLVGMGVHLLDNLALAELARACAERGRYEFLFLAAPLRVPGGTGSPLNPIAVAVNRSGRIRDCHHPLGRLVVPRAGCGSAGTR